MKTLRVIARDTAAFVQTGCQIFPSAGEPAWEAVKSNDFLQGGDSRETEAAQLSLRDGIISQWRGDWQSHAQPPRGDSQASGQSLGSPGEGFLRGSTGPGFLGCTWHMLMSCCFPYRADLCLQCVKSHLFLRTPRQVAFPVEDLACS